MKKLFFIMVIISLSLTACGDTGNDAARAVEGYYQALVQREENQFISYTCSDWEDSAYLEYDSFQGVAVSLDNLACQKTGEDGDMVLVACAGKIVATYNNENQDFPLDGRVHRVIKEGGDWRVCGY